MRVAPIGLYFWKNPEMAFKIGAESGALTHGHIDAILASGYFAAFVANIIAGAGMKVSATDALTRLKDHEGHEDCAAVIERAIKLASSRKSVIKAMEEIGMGYTAEEAVALAVFLTLRYGEDFDGAILAATTFNGNTDSIAPITGNALGAFYGDSIIPQKWINEVELSDLIIHGADLLLGKVDTEENEYGTI